MENLRRFQTKRTGFVVYRFTHFSVPFDTLYITFAEGFYTDLIRVNRVIVEPYGISDRKIVSDFTVGQ